MIQLESFIKQAGTYCLTKAVLEQKGFSFPKLEDLTILKLVRMTSFHIRKCHAAIDGLYRDNNKLGSVYLQWELRWISLSERLKATGLKIQKIQEGITEAEARKHLMDKAMREGDQAALLTIPMEDSDTFHARWVRYVEEAEAENRRRTGREGPSDATRKKLREKRKKRR